MKEGYPSGGGQRGGGWRAVFQSFCAKTALMLGLTPPSPSPHLRHENLVCCGGWGLGGFRQGSFFPLVRLGSPRLTEFRVARSTLCSDRACPFYSLLFLPRQGITNKDAEQVLSQVICECVLLLSRHETFLGIPREANSPFPCVEADEGSSQDGRRFLSLFPHTGHKLTSLRERESSAGG